MKKVGNEKIVGNRVGEVWKRFAVWAEERRKLLLLILLGVQGAGLAAAFFFFGVTIFPDSSSYMEPAQSFLSYGVMADADGLPTLYRTPGYLLFLAAVYGMGGGNVAVVLLQMCMCLLIGVMIYSIVKGVSGNAALGLGGLLLWVLHIENYNYTLSILTEIPFAFFCALALFFAYRFWQRGKYLDVCACFLSLNYGLLIRPQLMYYCMAVAVALAAASLLKKVPWKITIPYVCLFLICFGGWCARNNYHFGEPQYTFIRHKDYFEYYAPSVYMEVEKVSLEESKGYFRKVLEETVPDYDRLFPVDQVHALSEIGKTYVKQHVGAFIMVNFKGLLQEMFAPGVSYINGFGLPRWLEWCCYGFFALLLAITYGIYALGFLKNFSCLTKLDWLIFLTNVYLMASTAVVGYSRFRMAFYAPCLIGAFLCWRKFDKNAPEGSLPKGLKG